MQAPVRLDTGQELLVRYNAPGELWHARLLTSPVGRDSWITLTVDGDLWCEDYVLANCVDIQAVRVRPPGGGAPFGLKPGAIYDFAANRRLVPADWPGLLHETNLLAATEAGRLGLPPPPPAVAPGVVGLGVAPPALVLVAGAGARAPAVGGGVRLPIVVGGLVGGPVGLAAALGGAGPAAGVLGERAPPIAFYYDVESDIERFVMLWSYWRHALG